MGLCRASALIDLVDEPLHMVMRWKRVEYAAETQPLPFGPARHHGKLMPGQGFPLDRGAGDLVPRDEAVTAAEHANQQSLGGDRHLLPPAVQPV